jgi:archaeosortase B (VPXXXP-CTERM-specific)
MLGKIKSDQIKLKLKISPDKLKFIAKFAVFISIFYFLSIQFESYIPLFSMRNTALVLSSTLNMMGIKSVLKGDVLTFSGFTIQIVRQCTGIFEVIALSAVILAYPLSKEKKPKEKKLAGIMMALAVIYFFNLFRLVLLSLIGIHYPSLFEAVHEYLFQVTFVFLVIFLWLVWLRKVVDSGDNSEAKREIVKQDAVEKQAVAEK